jgi:hypothetical protein
MSSNPQQSIGFTENEHVYLERVLLNNVRGASQQIDCLTAELAAQKEESEKVLRSKISFKNDEIDELTRSFQRVNKKAFEKCWTRVTKLKEQQKLIEEHTS